MKSAAKILLCSLQEGMRNLTSGGTRCDRDNFCLSMCNCPLLAFYLHSWVFLCDPQSGWLQVLSTKDSSRYTVRAAGGRGESTISRDTGRRARKGEYFTTNLPSMQLGQFLQNNPLAGNTSPIKPRLCGMDFTSVSLWAAPSKKRDVQVGSLCLGWEGAAPHGSP